MIKEIDNRYNSKSLVYLFYTRSKRVSKLNLMTSTTFDMTKNLEKFYPIRNKMKREKIREVNYKRYGLRDVCTLIGNDMSTSFN